MFILLLECAAYLALGIQGINSKWELLAVTAFAGLLMLLTASYFVDTRFRFMVPVLAAAQMLCGVVLLVMTPPVLLQVYLPMVVLHMLLGVCSLFMNAEVQEPEKPRITAM